MAFKVPSDFGGDRGSGEGGGGGGTGQPRIVPPAPRDVSARVTRIGEFTVTWRDFSQSDWPHGIPFAWYVRYCPADLAGNPGDRPDTPAPEFYSWATDVLFKSKYVGSISAVGNGQVMSLTHREDLPDGYVQVVGSNGPQVGPCSYPLYVRLTANGNVAPDVGIVGPLGLTITKERVPRDVLRIDGQYGILMSPELNEFAGVHPHVTNYGGVSTAREIGRMASWDGSRGINTFTYRLPVEQGLASGTALFTHGSAAVLWISGDTFSAGHLGRAIIADYSSTQASPTYVVQTFTDTTHIDLNAVFFDPNGVGGTYAWKVFSNSTWYFVPIGKSGARVGDYTTAPSLSL